LPILPTVESHAQHTEKPLDMSDCLPILPTEESHAQPTEKPLDMSDCLPNMPTVESHSHAQPTEMPPDLPDCLAILPTMESHTQLTEKPPEQSFTDQSNIQFFAAVVPGTEATRGGVCNGLLHARLPEASGNVKADEVALDFLLEWVIDPQWSLILPPKESGSSAILEHFARCMASGGEMLCIASKFVLYHCAPGCSASECRAFDARVAGSTARGRRSLLDICNLAEAAALSGLPSLPKAPSNNSRARLKAISKRR
jgi:hypothetical protein